MNQLSLYKIVEVIVRRYSKISTRFLIDHYLRLKIIYNLSIKSLQTFLSLTDLSPGLISVFTNRTKEEKLVNFSCIVIDHPKLLTFHSKILRQVDNCIVLDSNFKQYNNILGKESPQSGTLQAKVILFRSYRQNFNSITQSLDSYLSICQLFHGHIHMIVNCFQCVINTAIKDYMVEAQGDQFQGVVEEGYFRILEERGSKITLQQISDICDIERNQWGQMLIFEGGQDGLILWITEKYLPKLGVTPNLTIPSSRSKQYLLFYSTDIGYKIFKKKNLMKEKMHQMNFTILILNFDIFTPQKQEIVTNKFDQYCKKFFSNVVINTQLRLLQENIRHGQRTCEILGIDEKLLMSKLLQL